MSWVESFARYTNDKCIRHPSVVLADRQIYLFERRAEHIAVSWRVAHEPPPVVVQHPFGKTGLAGAIAAIKREENAAVLQDAADVSECLFEIQIRNMMEHAVHHHKVGAAELGSGGGIEILAKKAATITKHFIGMPDIRRIDIKTNIVDIVWQIFTDVARSTTNIDNSLPLTNGQIVGNRLDASAKKASGHLERLVDCRRIQQRFQRTALLF
jgi:hypothetical protein